MILPCHIYIDGGDPEETKQADMLLKKAGYHGLDGQTTNPTLIAKKALSVKGKALSEKEAFDYYRKTVEEMSHVIPDGKISIQVIGDPAILTTEDMLTQARDRMTWISNGVIKFPCSRPGFEAVAIFCQEGPVNITLNFSQEQAAAVYAATKAHNYDVYISPFVGRLDDNHVRVLTASVRNMNHVLYALFLKSPVITIPFKVFKEWAGGGFTLPKEDFIYDVPGLTGIPYKELTLDKDWSEYDLSHPLTDAGLARFWEDWKSIVS